MVLHGHVAYEVYDNHEQRIFLEAVFLTDSDKEIWVNGRYSSRSVAGDGPLWTMWGKTVTDGRFVAVPIDIKLIEKILTDKSTHRDELCWHVCKKFFRLKR